MLQCFLKPIICLMSLFYLAIWLIGCCAEEAFEAHEIAHVLAPLQHGCAYCASCANDAYAARHGQGRWKLDGQPLDALRMASVAAS